MKNNLKLLLKDLKVFLNKWRDDTMSVAAETQCSKDVIVSIFHFLCFLMKTFTSHPFIFLFLVMSKNKEGSRSFIARMSSAYLNKPLVRRILELHLKMPSGILVVVFKVSSVIFV